jgi:hypothetical protein
MWAVSSSEGIQESAEVCGVGINDSSRKSFEVPVVSLDFSVTYSFRPSHGPGFASAPSENEYQEHFLGVKAVENLTTFTCQIS